MRLALGATRMRIVRLLVIENLVLALPGAVLGVLLAARAIPVFVGYAVALAAPSRLFLNIETDALVISFAVVVACGSALVFGFVPALRSSRIDLVSVIKEESPQGASRGVMRTGLVIAQVAVSLLLLVGAGLVTRSLVAAEQADRGFDGTHVTAVDVDLKANAYTEPQGRVFFRKLLDAARDQPGVEAAALAATTPLTFLDRGMQRVAIEGLATQQGDDLSMLSNVVSPDYFSTLRIPVMAGREFDDRDDEVSTPVVVINRTMAERFWGTAAAAIGKRISVGDSAWRTVAGVVADVKYSRVDEDPRPYVYLPFEQSYRAGMVLHTRGAVPMGQLVEQARGAVASLDADLPILEARSLQDATRGALIFFRLMASMLFVFGVAGIALAAMGTYGLVSYAVTQSTREIGIRMALGASGSSVIRVFLARGLRLGVIGAVVGLLAAVGASRLLGSLLYGVSATDPGSFVRAAAIVLGGVGLATIIPAWRASRTDPLRALRRQ